LIQNVLEDRNGIEYTEPQLVMRNSHTLECFSRINLIEFDARIAVKNVCNLHRRQEGLFVESEFPHGNYQLKKASVKISRVEWSG